MPQPADVRTFDRRLFLVVAILFPLIIVTGFAPTYYLKGLFGTPPLPSTLVHVHGLVMTAWVALFGVQVWLVEQRRIVSHQQLGYAGVALAMLIVATGLPTAVRAAKYGAASTPQGIDPLAFLAVPLFDLVVFALLFGAAVYYRRVPIAHKSLMLLTAVNFIPPAIARVPVPALQALGPLWFFGLPTLFATTCLVLDARRRGRVNRVFLVGTLVLVGSYVGRLVLMTSDAWMRAAAWMVTFV